MVSVTDNNNKDCNIIHHDIMKLWYFLRQLSDHEKLLLLQLYENQPEQGVFNVIC